ncbi:hypothetical protein F2P81_020559 [Scophthalmus maximus]|uniref:Sec7/BIG1-like C-terminal domain-containing protein n=1 Tax=Scophthalmus maximus TaxID=52904 RepID=A0A6A4S6K0_SCOMX|nr:hypothetical protein F2P81_020559 [Scophthalmus maximus]
MRPRTLRDARTHVSTVCLCDCSDTIVYDVVISIRFFCHTYTLSLKFQDVTESKQSFLWWISRRVGQFFRRRLRGEGGGSVPLALRRGRVLEDQSYGSAGRHVIDKTCPVSQVFMLDTQCSPKTPSSKDGFEHAQSCVLIIEMPSDQLSNGHAQKRIPFRTIVVSLLSHQVLLQNLSDILLEEFVKQPEGHERVTPVTSDPGRPTAGFLRYISMTNLAIILDLLLDSYRTARDFDTRPGLKYLLMKVSGVCGAANLYRQSAMSFNLYFQALLSATLSQADGMTAQQVKRILYEEEEHSSDSSHPGSASSEDEDIFEETAQVSPPRGRDKRHQWRAPIPSLSVQPLGGGDWAWLVKRLYKLCMDLCNSYIQMHRDLESTLEEAALLRGGGGGGGGDHIFLLPLFQSETSTPTCTGSLPRRDSGATASSGGGAPGSVGTGRRKEWWESAGNKLYTIATDKTISKLMLEYKRRKQQQPPPQSHVNLFMKEQGRAGSAAGGGIVGEPQRPPQRPQQLVDQQGPPLRHSVSAGPEVLRQEKRPRSGSTISSHSISLRDSEAQIQAWTNMVLTLLNQTLLLTDASFLALQPALYPCLSQLSCHVTDARVRQALREWLGRVGRLYDIILDVSWPLTCCDDDDDDEEKPLYGASSERTDVVDRQLQREGFILLSP